MTMSSYLRDVHGIERCALFLDALDGARSFVASAGLLSQEGVQHRPASTSHLRLGQRIQEKQQPHWALPLPITGQSTEKVVAVQPRHGTLLTLHPLGQHSLHVDQVSLDAREERGRKDLAEVLRGWKELTTSQRLDGVPVGEIQLEDDLVGRVKGGFGGGRDKVPDFAVGYVNRTEKV